MEPPDRYRSHEETGHDQEATAVVNGMSSLPAHPEVPGALRRLRATNLTLVTLTNPKRSPRHN